MTAVTDPENPLTDERLTLVGLFLETNRGLIRALKEVHESHGLQGSEFDALLRLAHAPGGAMRMVDLAGQTMTSTSGVTSLVDRLQAHGYVERVPSPGDRRSFLVRVTEEGLTLLRNDVAQLIPVIQRGVLDPLGSDTQVVRRAVERMRDRLSPEASGK